jgi:hypothetical protein
VPEGLRRADEGQAGLLVAVEYLDLHPAALAHGGAQLTPVAGSANGGRRHRAKPARAELVGQADLRRHHPRHLVELSLGDRLVAAQALAEPRERALLHDLLELPVRGLRHEQPRRVRPDVDAGVERGHSGRSCHARGIDGHMRGQSRARGKSAPLTSSGPPWTQR